MQDGQMVVKSFDKQTTAGEDLTYRRAIMMVSCRTNTGLAQKQEAKLSLGQPTVLPHSKISDCS